MIFYYDFEDEDEFFRGLPYEYEVDYDKIQEALVEILCNGSKEKHRKLYSEDGNYQMAMYVVYELDVFDALVDYFRDDLKDYFEAEAKTYFFEGC